MPIKINSLNYRGTNKEIIKYEMDVFYNGAQPPIKITLATIIMDI